MSPLAFYRDLISKGVPEAVAYEMAAKFEAEREADYLALLAKDQQKRAKDRARKATKVSAELPRKLRGTSAETPRKSAEAPRNIQGNSSEAASAKDAPAPVRTRVRDISPKLVISGSDDDVDCASAPSSSDDWPKLTGKQTWASVLAETVASPWLDPTKSPGLIETAGRVVAWKRDGASWEHDVVPVVSALCVKAGKRVGTWKYFDASVAQAIADNRAALAIPDARVVPLHPGGGQTLTDRIAAEHAEARRKAFEMMDARDGRTN